VRNRETIKLNKKKKKKYDFSFKRDYKSLKESLVQKKSFSKLEKEFMFYFK